MNCSHLYGIRLCAGRADGFNESLPSANEVCEGYVFTGVCLYMGGGSLFLGGGESLSRGWGVSVQGMGVSVQGVSA